MENLSSSQNGSEQLVVRYESMVREGRSEYFDINELMLVADYYMDNGQPGKSMEALNYAAQLYPDDIDVQLSRCEAMLSQGRGLEAMELLDSLPDQNDREVMFMRATVCLHEQFFDEADRVLRALSEEEGNSKDVLLDIAFLYLDSGMPEEAYKWAFPLFDDYSDDWEVRDFMLQYAYNTQNYDQAIGLINKNLDENPYRVRDWLDLARCYISLDMPEKAFEAIDFALAVNGENVTALQLRMLCFLKIEEYRKAMDVGKKLIGLAPKSVNTYQNVASCAMDLEEFDEAIHYLDMGLRECLPEMTSIDKSSFYQQRAEAYLRKGDWATCKADLDLSLQYNVENPMAYLICADYCLERGDRRGAREAVRNAELYAGEDEYMLKNVALLYIDCGLYGDALRAAESLEKLLGERRFRKYCYLMAYCQWLVGDKQEGFLKYIVKAIVYTPATVSRKAFGVDDSAFLQMVEQVRFLLEKGEINAEDYLDS